MPSISKLVANSPAVSISWGVPPFFVHKNNMAKLVGAAVVIAVVDVFVGIADVVADVVAVVISVVVSIFVPDFADVVADVVSDIFAVVFAGVVAVLVAAGVAIVVVVVVFVIVTPWWLLSVAMVTIPATQVATSMRNHTTTLKVCFGHVLNFKLNSPFVDTQ